MANRLAVGDRAPGKGEGAWCAVDGANGATVGTGLWVAEGLGLLFEQSLESAVGQAGGSGAGHLFHSVEIHVQPRTVIAEGTAGDNFAPTGSEVVDFLEERGGKFTTRHGQSCLGVVVEVQE